MLIIGIAGLKNSGKSSFAKEIREVLTGVCKKSVHNAPFARALKEMCETLFGEAAWYGTDAEKNTIFPFWEEQLGELFKSPRRILQTMGTDIFREHVHKDFWLMVQKKYLLDVRNFGAQVAIIDDVRFENEADFIREHDGLMFHVRRNNILPNNDQHASEKGVVVKHGDHLFNFNSLEEMKTAAHNIVMNIRDKESYL